jgi:hypothetical protein
MGLGTAGGQVQHEAEVNANATCQSEWMQNAAVIKL